MEYLGNILVARYRLPLRIEAFRLHYLGERIHQLGKVGKSSDEMLVRAVLPTFNNNRHAEIETPTYPITRFCDAPILFCAQSEMECCNRLNKASLDSVEDLVPFLPRMILWRMFVSSSLAQKLSTHVNDGRGRTAGNAVSAAGLFKADNEPIHIERSGILRAWIRAVLLSETVT